MPMAAMSRGVACAASSASAMVLRCVSQISSASCSTQPGSGKCWVNSRWLSATIRPVASNNSERELVVPASSARMNLWVDPGAVLTFDPSGSEPARLEARGPVDGVDGAHVADRVVAAGQRHGATFDDVDDVTEL